MFVVEAESQFPKERGGTKSQLNSHGYNLVTVVFSSSRDGNVEDFNFCHVRVLKSEQCDLRVASYLCLRPQRGGLT